LFIEAHSKGEKIRLSHTGFPIIVCLRIRLNALLNVFTTTMGTVEGFHVQGTVRVVESSSFRQIVIELKPDLSELAEICGFCCNPSSENESQNEHQTLSMHAHSLKGSFFVIPDQNQIKLTINDCGKENWSASETHRSQLAGSSSSDANPEPPQKTKTGVFQYEVDGELQLSSSNLF